jgi:hypothetical protein
MSETIAITTIAEAERRFGLIRNEDPNFFWEWQRFSAELTEQDSSQLADLRRRYVYHRSAGHLLENTVTLLLASPLLAIAGFYDPPFRVRAEESGKLIIQDSEEILQGRIDALVICDSFWVMILESKKTMLSIWSALPQALAYLMANPHINSTTSPQNNLPGFGMLTNGDEMLFVKVDPTQCDDSHHQPLRRYGGGFSSSQMRFLALQAGQPLCLHKQQTTVQPSVSTH